MNIKFLSAFLETWQELNLTNFTKADQKIFYDQVFYFYFKIMNTIFQN